MRLALTLGDPAGIGRRVVLKALADPDRPAASLVLYGPAAALEDRARRFGLKSRGELGAEVVDIPLEGPVPLGRTSAAGGRAAALAVLRAAEDAMAGRVDAIVTAPVNKESLDAAGYRWPGHTEMLAEAAGTPDVAMMFVGGTLRVALLTIHRALRTVSDAVTGGEVRRVTRLVHNVLPRFGSARPHSAVCPQNTHRREGRVLGREARHDLSDARHSPRR